MHDRKLRNTRRLIAGMTVTLVISFTTAVMMMLPPQHAVSTTDIDAQYSLPAISEYVQLHQARHTVAPNYMYIDVATTSR